MAYKGYNPGVVSSAYSAFVKKAEKDEKKREKKNAMIAQMTNNVIKSVFTGIKGRDTKIRADLRESDATSTSFTYKDKNYNVLDKSSEGSWGGILGGNLQSIDKRVEYSEEFLQLIETDPDAYAKYLKDISSGGDLYDWNKELLNLGAIHTSIIPQSTAYDDLITKYGQDLVDKHIGDKSSFYEDYGSGRYSKKIKRLDKILERKNNKLSKKSSNVVSTDPASNLNLAESVEDSSQFVDLTSLNNLNVPDDQTIKEFILQTGEEFDKKYDVFDDSLDVQVAENVSPGAEGTIGGITPGALSAADASMENYFATVGSNVADPEVFDTETNVLQTEGEDTNLFTAMDLFLTPGMNAWQDWSSETDWFNTDDVTIDSDTSVT